MTAPDHEARAAVLERLPLESFRPQPRRCLLLIPLVTLAVGLSVALVANDWPVPVMLVVAVVIGNLYGSLMFLTHEIGHGATVRSQKLALLLMYPGCAVFLFSPHLWIVWHNRSHHHHTNRPDEDPDSYGSLRVFDDAPRWRQQGTRWYPGPGFLYSGVCLLLTGFFFWQAQSVLWIKSRVLPGYASFRRRRAIVDSIAMLGFWTAVAAASGVKGIVFIILIPMWVANGVVLSYVATNHMLRPLSATSDILKTTMGVTTLRFVDHLHFHFSHHVEHHLFPSMPTSRAPAARQVLADAFPDEYLAPTHLRALAMLLRTPRFYASPDQLAEPFRGRRRDLGAVAELLRSGGRRRPLDVRAAP
jgi:fatty acid desaturase